MGSVNRLWNPDSGEAEWLRLIEFIEPSDPVLKPILKQAQQRLGNLTAADKGEAFDELSAYEPPPRWSSYGTPEEYVRYQVRAIYEALREHGIGYAVERWDSQPPAQVIRSHEEIVDSEGIGGPCIDLVVLMAACLEAIGIQPLVIVMEEEKSGRRHAILAYRLKELGPKTPVDKIPHLVVNLVINGKQESERKFGLLSEQELYGLKNTGDVEFINCTGITRGENVCFEKARSQGKDYVEQWNLVFALDIRVARHTAFTREMQDYLKRLRDDILILPPAFGFPPDRNFPEIRVQVKVRKGGRRFSETEARAWEMSRRQGYADEELEAKAYHYPWPSPEEMEREAERPLDWDREVQGRLKRAVVLGDPGFGKTWLLKQEALQLAERALRKLEEHPLATGEVQLPIFLPLAQLAAQADEEGQPLPLDRAILSALENRYPLGERLREWIEENLDSERLVLLLDALDEVPSAQKESLCERLDAFARKYTRPQILLTSRLVGYPGAPFSLPKEGEFELLPFDRRQQRDFVRAWFSGRPERGETFLRKLRESPQVQALAGIPLLLALMCRLFDEMDELPKSRAELYEACIWGILTQKWKTPRSEDEPYLHAKLRLIEEVAYCLFIIAEKELFYLDDLLDLVGEIFQDHPQLKENLGYKSSADLIGELQEDGLLIKAGVGVNPPFLFLHLTFQEYLAACALARRTKLVQMDGEKVPEWLKLVKPHLFDPRWEEVIRLLAAKLEDATPLVEAIWQEREDIFLGRLLLAGKCLADARHVQNGLRERIIGKVLALARNTAQRSARTLTSQLSPLDLLDVIDVRELFGTLLRMLAAAYTEIQEKLISMLKEGGGINERLLLHALAATLNENAISHLIKCLKNGEPSVRMTAAKTLGEIRSEQAVPALIELLKDNEPLVRQFAATALGEIGSEQAIPYLVELLKDHDVRRRAIAEALGEIGSEQAIPYLVELLKDHDVRGPAAEALGEIGSEQAIPHLILLLEDPNFSIKQSAEYALGQIGSKEAIPHLIPLLKHADRLVRWFAARALGQIGSKEAIPHLIPLLKQPDPAYSESAAEALGQIGSEEAVPALIELLKQPHPDVSRAAIRALGEIKSEKAVPYLTDLLKDPEPWVRAAAAEALGKIKGEKGVHHLIQLLKDPHPHVREAAAWALGKIRSEEAMPHLTDLLKDPDSWVRWHAAEALGEIGSEESVPHLIDLFKDPDPYMRLYAAKALKEISRKQGIRIFPDGSYTSGPCSNKDPAW